MKNAMMTTDEAAARINDGAVLVIAGSEAALSKLPVGKWIGGTSVYFMAEDGGRVDLENVFVTEIDGATNARAVMYIGEDLPNLTMGRFEGGMSMILIPGFSNAHQDFAIKGAEYAGVFEQPLMGWIAGVHLDDIGKETPKVFDGATATAHEDGAAVLHVEVPEGAVADINIVNLFTQDDAADEITFPATGFEANKAIVNGEEVDFAAYVSQNGIDTALPLVANYAGAMINVSFQAVGEDKVDFYAPVIKGVTYRLAKSPGDYAACFAEQVTADGSKQLSCNCILNYVYGALEGKTTGSATGPATFGEIAYILLNQTFVHMDLRAATGAHTRVA
ncbi:MAG: DUF6976 family protein [Maritimibacter sp.]